MENRLRFNAGAVQEQRKINAGDSAFSGISSFVL